jgi:hypothetical protein
MKSPEIKWTCTDANTNQYGRHLGGTVYEFYEGDDAPVKIDLANYKVDQIEYIINAYSYTLGETDGGYNNIKEQYPEESGSQNADWVVAKCIYETEEAPLKSISEPSPLIGDCFIIDNGGGLSWAICYPISSQGGSKRAL